MTGVIYRAALFFENPRCMIQKLTPEHPLFRGAPPQALAQLSKGCVRRELKRGDVLVDQGAPVDRTWLLTEGALHGTSLSAGGRSVTMAILTPGDVYGYLQPLHEGGYFLRLSAMMPSRAVGLPERAFQQFLESHPAAGLALERQTAGRVAELSQLHRLCFDPALQRVCLAIELLERKLGSRIPVSRLQLASIVGLAPETVSRTLTELRGAVSLRRGTLLVLDQRALRARAGL